MLQPRFRIHAPFARANDGGARIKTKHGWAMTEKEERLARDRAEIAARVASFRETQQKFEREREEYYETTLANAEWNQPAPVLALRRNQRKLARPSPLSPTKYFAWNRKRISPGILPRILPWRERERSRCPQRFLFKCSNLARGESTNDPVYIFECGRGFSLTSGRSAPRDRKPCDKAGLIIGLCRN
jgi:hypothetical protein